MPTVPFTVHVPLSDVGQQIQSIADTDQPAAEYLARKLFTRSNHVDKTVIVEQIIKQVVKDCALPHDYFNV